VSTSEQVKEMHKWRNKAEKRRKAIVFTKCFTVLPSVLSCVVLPITWPAAS